MDVPGGYYAKWHKSDKYHIISLTGNKNRTNTKKERGFILKSKQFVARGNGGMECVRKEENKDVHTSRYEMNEPRG